MKTADKYMKSADKSVKTADKHEKTADKHEVSRSIPLPKSLILFGEPIPGLYAAGEVTGGFRGAGYMTGNSLGKQRCLEGWQRLGHYRS